MWLAVGVSYYLLAMATTGIPIGVAFAFWEGLGLTLVTLTSMIFLREMPTARKIAGLCCVLVGAWLVHKGTKPGKRRGHG